MDGKDLVTNGTSQHVYTVFRNKALQGGTVIECNNPVMIVINTDYPSDTYCIDSELGCGGKYDSTPGKEFNVPPYYSNKRFWGLWLNSKLNHRRRATIQVISQGGNYISNCNEPGKATFLIDGSSLWSCPGEGINVVVLDPHSLHVKSKRNFGIHIFLQKHYRTM